MLIDGRPLFDQPSEFDLRHYDWQDSRSGLRCYDADQELGLLDGESAVMHYVNNSTVTINSKCGFFYICNVTGASKVIIEGYKIIELAELDSIWIVSGGVPDGERSWYEWQVYNNGILRPLEQL